MRKGAILACLVLVLIIAGCINNISENPCKDCRLQCPDADRTACVNDNKCECYYDETITENNTSGFTNNSTENNQSNLSNNYTENNQTDLNENSGNFFETLPSCGDRMDFLEVSPMNYGDFRSIIPLGGLSPPSHVFPIDHIYLMIKRGYQNNKDIGTANVPIYMPGDGWIVEIGAVEHLSENPPYTDYGLVFYPCKELKFELGHVTSLSEEILSKLNASNNCEESEAGGKRFRSCSYKNLKFKVNSGQEIGTAGGNPGQNALDLTATDYRKTEDLKFANPDSWYNYESMKYSVCPLDYFIKEEKETLYALLTDFDNNKRTTEPLCGTIEQDIKGTAQGAWFVKGTTNTYPESPHLALALDIGGNSTINVFSIGTSIPDLNPGRYPFDLELTGNVNTAFSKVTPGNIYCYEQKYWDFVIVLELLNDTSLKIEKQTANECKKPYKFNSGVLFER